MDNNLHLHIDLFYFLSLLFQIYNLVLIFLLYILQQVLLNTNIYYLHVYYLLQEHKEVLEMPVLHIHQLHF